MKDEKLLIYETPIVEFIKVEVEQGFATSDTPFNTTPWDENEGIW